MKSTNPSGLTNALCWHRKATANCLGLGKARGNFRLSQERKAAAWRQNLGAPQIAISEGPSD